MAADQHRGEVVVGPRPAREDGADAIDRHRAARFRAPRDEEITHLLVGVGESQSAQTARLARADLPGAHDRVPESRGVDPDGSVARGHQ